MRKAARVGTFRVIVGQLCCPPLWRVIAVIALYVSATAADRRIAEAQARAAGLEKDAAQLRLDLERERALREPRTLSQTQQNAVAEKIRTFAGTGFVMYVELASEPVAFLLQLEAVLRTAKWVPHAPVPPAPDNQFT